MEACGRHSFTLDDTYDAYPNRKNVFFVVFLDKLPCSLLNDITRIDKDGVFYC
jgi:hypothetical protein